jgi:two-component system, OmpR family, sensor histidine kinase CiaH
MAFSFYKTKRIRFIFLAYWLLLAYIIAALIWWFIALNMQNRQMATYKMEQLKKDDPSFFNYALQINETEKRKTAQYIGEGSIFLLLIITGAVFLFRAVRRQFKSSQQQQNFIMAITHELKTPIAVTKLNLETLQKRKLEESQQQRLIQNTIQEANRLNTLCNNMLLASQIEAGGYSISTEDINLSELINNCVNDFSTRFPQRNFSTDIHDNLFVNGDKLLLEMAANNLIDNAIKYSPKESFVEVLLNADKNKIIFSVKDEGKGIADTEKKKVFDKFYRVANMGAKGTGLGLYLTKKIAQQHNATIFVKDNTPAGSNFIISFKPLPAER